MSYYPNIFDRVKAVLFDTVIIIGLMYVISLLFQAATGENTSLRIIAFATIWLIYDPLMTTIFGGTLGHQLIGLRVKSKKDESKNLNFFQAIIRYILKTLLGWISFITVSTKLNKQAIHDLAVSSVVIKK